MKALIAADRAVWPAVIDDDIDEDSVKGLAGIITLSSWSLYLLTHLTNPSQLTNITQLQQALAFK